MKRSTLWLVAAVLLLAGVTHAESTALDDYAARVEQAFTHFRAREYLKARLAFDRALERAETSAERATLTFNAAVAAFEAGDYVDAEQRFVASIRHDPASLSLCQVHAGLAALRANAPERARQHLARATSDAPAAREKRLELEQALLELAHQQKLARFRGAVGLGRAAQQRGAWADARRHYETALALDPAAVDVRVALGDVAAHAGHFANAEASYGEARKRAGSPKLRALLEQRINDLYPIPAPGTFVSAEATAGFDSNAAQSGAANAIGVTGAGPQSSGLSRLSLTIDWLARTSRRTALASYYSGTALLLLDPKVAELSLQSHELGLSWYFAPSYRTRLRLSGSALAQVIGQSTLQLFSFAPGISGQFEAEHSRIWSTRLTADARRLDGLNGRNALDGRRLELVLRESARLGSTTPWLELGGGQNAMGVTAQYTTPEDFSLCSNILPFGQGPCRGGGLYRIPLGYSFLAGSLGASFEPTGRLSLSGSLKLEYRHYLEDSVLVLNPAGPGPSGLGETTSYRRRRADLRRTLNLRSEWALDAKGRFWLVGGYSLLISSSNIAQGRGGLAHALDYDDRNFTQHVLDAGVLFKPW